MKLKVIAAAGLAVLMLTGTAGAQAGSFCVGGEIGMGQLSGDDGMGSAMDKAKELVDWLGGRSYAESRDGQKTSRLFTGYEFANGLGLEVGWKQSDVTTWNIQGQAGDDFDGNFYFLRKEASFKGLDASVILHASLIPDAPQALAPAFIRLGATRYAYKITQLTGGGLSDVTDDGAAFSSSGHTNQRTTKTEQGIGSMLGVGYDFPMGIGALRVAYTASLNVAGKDGFDHQQFSVGYQAKF